MRKRLLNVNKFFKKYDPLLFLGNYFNVFIVVVSMTAFCVIVWIIVQSIKFLFN